ncbi:helicase-related protein [Bacillus mexicanus]|uniref:helicase-related protein n=1 Tax=Bacillus mexicanus TaxID=2834415 RepID=UPI003D1FC071
MGNYRLSFNNGERQFEINTDLLIAKRTEKRNEMQILAVSLYHTKTELNKLIKKNSGANASLNGHPAYKKTKFIINKFSNYEKNEVQGKYHQRVTLVRKKELLIDETKESYPIVMLPKEETKDLQTIIFEYVRDNIVSPLFPDVRYPQVLAGELFISCDQAEEILQNIENGIIETEEEKLASEMLVMYHQWANYLTTELIKRNRLHHLEVIACPREIIAYELMINEKEIRDIISTGLQYGYIYLSKNNKVEKRYDKFDEYMPVFSGTFKKRIESIAQTEHYYGNIRKQTQIFLERLGNSPISIQIDAIEAGLKSLKKQKRFNLVGQPGVGKTYMMSSIAFLDSLYNKKPMKLLVYSPDHLVESAWQRETEETLIEATYHHITSVSDIIKYDKEGYLTDTKHRVFILSQSAAKNGYSLIPNVHWESKLLPAPEESIVSLISSKVFVCTDCGEVITKRITNPNREKGEPKIIEVPVPIDHFNTERYNNRKCNSCGSILWGVSNKKGISFKQFMSGDKKQSKFVLTDMGFLPRDEKSLLSIIKDLSEKQAKDPKKSRASKLKSLRKALEQLRGNEKTKNIISLYKVPVAEFIFKKYKSVFTHLIIDEAHEIQNNTSSRTQAAGKLIASVPKIITGTGTMMNGYARSLFYTFFMLYPRKMKEAGFEVSDIEKFQVAFGVTEKRFRLIDGKKKPIAPKSKPGISPVIFPMFLQDTSVFMSMDDLDEELPKLETKPIGVEIPKEIIQGKEELEKVVKKIAKGNIKLFKTIIPALYSYLDMPTVPKIIKDESGSVVYKTKVIPDAKDYKLEKLKEIIKHEIHKNNNRVIVYTYYTGDGINDYLKEKLLEEGYQVTVLNKNAEYSYSCEGSKKKIPKKKREEFIKEEVKKGAQILITNPELVKTGTNLVDFAPIVRYQMDYQVYTERQARGRTRRIGQVKDCTIYYLYYFDSLQEDITKLMATKIVASEAIEGNMDAAGLEAITDTRSPEEELSNLFFKSMDLY